MPVRAYAAKAAGKRLEPYSYDPPALGPHDVEIAVSHCGICHSDIHLIDNDWQISAYPLVPGHEVVGTVTRAGADVKGPAVGERVGVGWQCGCCMACEWCERGDEPSCAENRATCVGHPGGFGESITADSRFAFPIPESLPSETAAPLLCGGITVYTPLREYARPAHRVGVIGIGGLGHLALQFARAFGCEVTAFSTSADKEAEATEFGAHRFVVSTRSDAMKQVAGHFDILLSTVSADLDWPEWMNLLRQKGRLQIVGASPGNVSIPATTYVMGQKSVGGTVIGTRSSIREMLDFAARHEIRAKSEVMPLDQVNDAIARVRANEARYRMVLKM
jgi:uncharacterized zinc-type alcohol dehydrogenase-like protein